MWRKILKFFWFLAWTKQGHSIPAVPISLSPDAISNRAVSASQPSRVTMEWQDLQLQVVPAMHFLLLLRASPMVMNMWIAKCYLLASCYNNLPSSKEVISNNSLFLVAKSKKRGGPSRSGCWPVLHRRVLIFIAWSWFPSATAVVRRQDSIDHRRCPYATVIVSRPTTGSSLPFVIFHRRWGTLPILHLLAPLDHQQSRV